MCGLQKRYYIQFLSTVLSNSCSFCELFSVHNYGIIYVNETFVPIVIHNEKDYILIASQDEMLTK